MSFSVSHQTTFLFHDTIPHYQRMHEYNWLILRMRHVGYGHRKNRQFQNDLAKGRKPKLGKDRRYEPWPTKLN